jgi:NhaP-type Na+/H+ or K+/H+ antiporter
MLLSSFILLRLQVQLEQELIYVHSAISWWSIAYLVIIGSVLTFAYIYMLQKLPRR